MIGWVLAGAAILLVLAVYAASLLLKLRAQSRARATAIRACNERILESVRLIAKAVKEGQCDPSEGAIRLTNLLDALQYARPRPHAEEFPGLYGLYERIKDLPTHEARRLLKKNELLRQDLERARHEEEHNDQIQEDVARLAAFTLPV